MAFTPLVDGDPASPTKLNAIFTELDNSIGGGGGVAGGGQFINVLDETYGAAGDGVTDDSAAVAAAIDACDATLGGTILFPGGKNYLIDTVTLDNPNITFVAWGAKFTKAATTTTHMFIDTAAAADGFTLHGGTFDLSRASFSNGDTVSAFHFVRTNNLSFYNARFEDGIEEGLKLYRTKYVRVHNCVFDNIRNNGVQLLATDTDGYTGSGRATQSVEWAWIHGCHFKDIDDGNDGSLEGQAVSFGSTSTSLRVKHVYITSNSTENCIRGFWSENNTGGSPAFDVVVNDNTLFESDHHGIGLFGVVGGSVKGNVLLDMGTLTPQVGGSSENFGIKIGASTATTKAVVVEGNAIIDSRASAFMEYGIWTTGADEITIKDNRISGAAISNLTVTWSTMTKSTVYGSVPPASKTSGTTTFDLADAAWTNIPWGGVEYDTESLDSMHTTSSGRSHYLTCWTPGKWKYEAAVSFPSDSSGLRGARLALGPNGDTVIAEEIRAATSGDDTSFTISATADADTEDAVRLLLYQSSGTTMVIPTTNDRVWLAASYIGGDS